MQVAAEICVYTNDFAQALRNCGAGVAGRARLRSGAIKAGDDGNIDSKSARNTRRARSSRSSTAIVGQHDAGRAVAIALRTDGAPAKRRA